MTYTNDKMAKDVKVAGLNKFNDCGDLVFGPAQMQKRPVKDVTQNIRQLRYAVIEYTVILPGRGLFLSLTLQKKVLNCTLINTQTVFLMDYTGSQWSHAK